MIRINEDGDICYFGKDENETLYYPCDVDCPHNFFLTRKELDKNPLTWYRCLVCQYFIPVDMHEE